MKGRDFLELWGSSSPQGPIPSSIAVPSSLSPHRHLVLLQACKRAVFRDSFPTLHVEPYVEIQHYIKNKKSLLIEDQQVWVFEHPFHVHVVIGFFKCSHLLKIFN